MLVCHCYCHLHWHFVVVLKTLHLKFVLQLHALFSSHCSGDVCMVVSNRYKPCFLNDEHACFNNNVTTAIKSFPASCLTLASYDRCCQCGGQCLLTTSYDGRALLTTTVVWCQVEQETVLISEHIFLFEPRLSPQGTCGQDLSVATESAVPTS